jgi:phosphoenolpyruvate carboxylase
MQSDKDAPLKEDIRLLGRLLGDVLRDQEGEAVFDVVETIRQTAVRFRREADAKAGVELTTLLQELTRDQTNSVVRAFSYFSHLANIAEDQHHIRRRRAHLLAGSAPQPGSVAYALSRLQDAGVVCATRSQTSFASADLAGADGPPDRSAAQEHPRRRARHRAPAGRARPAADAEGSARNTELLQARIATLWQTRMLRYDQADGGRRDRKRPVLLPHHLPARTAGAVRRHRRRAAAAVFALRQPKPMPTPAYVQMGSWIGGDRDGNPNVNAGTMQRALVRHATTIFDFYLDEVHALGAELSTSTLMVPAPAPNCRRWPTPRPTPRRTAADEPYRRALIGIYARLAATARAWAPPTSCARKSATPTPTPDRPSSSAELQVLADSLAANHGVHPGQAAPGGLLRAADIFGFHLASLDMRQSSDVHERVLAELFASARREADYAGARRSGQGQAAAGRTGQPRLLYSPYAEYSDETQSELASCARRARSASATARARSATTSSRTPKTVSDLLEVLLLQKETGLLRPAKAEAVGTT